MAAPSIGNDLELAQIDYQRKQQLADALRKQSMESPQGQMIGRRYVAPSWTQGIAQLMEGYQSGEMGRQGLDELRNARQAYDTRNQGEMQNFMSAMRGTPASESQNVVPDEYGQMANQPIQNPAQDPNQAKALALALQSKNPMLQSMGGTMLKEEMFPETKVVGRSILTNKGKLIGVDPTVEAERLAKTEEAQRAQKDKIDAARELAAQRSIDAKERQAAEIALRRELAGQSNETRRAIMAAGRQSDIPKLKQGEIWNPAEQRVDAVKGSDTYIKQSGLHGKDYAALNGIDTKLDNAIETIDKILDPKNKDAFNSNFGGYNALISNKFPGKTQDTRLAIESLKSNMKNAGLEMMRSGGAIGAMTEKEWPIVEGMISRIDPTLSESEARAELQKVAAYMGKIKSNAREAYNTEWGSTQYVKPQLGGAKPDQTKSSSPKGGAKFLGFE
jgi:hypothetical protein